MARGVGFWNFMAKRYAKQPIRDMASYELTLARTRAHLSKDHRVLEVGCGTGSTALILADAVGDYTGADSSQKMVEIATDKLAGSDLENLRFRLAEVGDPALSVEPVDRLLAYNLLHLLPDLDAGLRALFQALKPGGLFVSKTICVSSGSHFWRGLLGLLAPLGLLPYVNFLGHETLEKAFKDAGFEIVESENLPEGGKSRFIIARRPV